MKFIHCSDIHLDSKMERNLTAAQARERNAEICATFSRMAAFASEQGVAAVIMAGDLFDTQRATAQTVGFVLDTVRNAPGVDFLYLRGNHDISAFAGWDLPENFKTFGESWTYHRYGDVVIAGMELEPAYDALNLPEETVNIVTLHGQVSTQPGEEMIALPLLKRKNIDYLALGHIHGYQSGKLDDRGSWCYCGCLEGRGFDELGPKGFVLVTVENQTVSHEFISFARRTLEEVAVDITDLTTVSQILTAAEKACEGVPAENLVKLTLTGNYTLETQKDLQFLTKMLEGRFWFLKIKDESRLKIEKESYEHDLSLKGEFIRLVMASSRTEAEKEQMILCGIRALSGEEVAL